METKQTYVDKRELRQKIKTISLDYNSPYKASLGAKEITAFLGVRTVISSAICKHLKKWRLFTSPLYHLYFTLSICLLRRILTFHRKIRQNA